MHIILLSGGEGKRLWPISNANRAKQFIKLFPGGMYGNYESMIQRVHRQIKQTLPLASVIVATSSSQVTEIYNQLGNDIDLSIEPCRRNTFPAVVLATANLFEKQGISPDEAVIVCPIDSFVDDSYFLGFAELSNIVEENKANIALLGIKPTEPSEAYGYILPIDDARISICKKFCEKPNRNVAEEYIAAGALWNSGVFACKADYIRNKSLGYFKFNKVQEIIDNFDKFPNISLDYALTESENNIVVKRYNGKWKDIGEWKNFTGEMSQRIVGRAIIDDESDNTYIVNELNLPILCANIKNTIIAITKEGILVANREETRNLKSMVEKLQHNSDY